MELSKLLLKLLYLALLYVCFYLLIKPQVQMSGANLSVSLLSISILLVYFTFDKGYDYLTKNEIVIQKEGTDKREKDSDDKDSKYRNKVEIVDKVHKETSSNSLFDHTHKFVQDKVFN